jgi:hypothetical protein
MKEKKKFIVFGKSRIFSVGKLIGAYDPIILKKISDLFNFDNSQILWDLLISNLWNNHLF